FCYLFAIEAAYNRAVASVITCMVSEHSSPACMLSVLYLLEEGMVALRRPQMFVAAILTMALLASCGGAPTAESPTAAPEPTAKPTLTPRPTAKPKPTAEPTAEPEPTAKPKP